MINKTIYVNDIRPGNKVDDAFLIAEKNTAVSQKGNPYLTLKLRDKTGDVEGRIWDNTDELGSRFEKGNVVLIQSRAISFRNVIQLSITNITAINESEFNPADYLPSSQHNVEDMFSSLMAHIDSIKNPHLKALLESIFTDSGIAHKFKKAPAAKGFHHFYIGGLLEHTLSVVKLLVKIADHYPTVNRDLLITAGILHDIGKIDELSIDSVVEYTDEGRLIGHIILGLEIVNAKISLLEAFPEQTAMELRHIMLSHHGLLEYGSPKRPKTVEALIVNFIDDLDAKVNAFQGFINESTEDTPWTPYHRLLERYIYKGEEKD